MKKNKISKSSSEESLDTNESDYVYVTIDNKATWADIVPYFNSVLLFATYFFGWYYLNHCVFIGVWYFFVITPLLDLLLPVDETNLTKEAAKSFEKDKRFLIPLYTHVAIDTFLYFWSMYQFVYSDFYSTTDRILFVLATTQLASITLALGHELLHRRETVHKIFGTY